VRALHLVQISAFHTRFEGPRPAYSQLGCRGKSNGALARLEFFCGAM